MNTGYIKLFRKIEDSLVFTNSDMLKLWMLCMLKATHKERKFLFNGNEVTLKEGDFVTGRESLAEHFNKGVKKTEKANERTLWRYMKKFEELEMLSIKSNTRYSVVSIVKWSEYQGGDQQVSNDCPSSVHQVSTYKNDKNEKNDKNKDIVESSSDKTIPEIKSSEQEIENNFDKLWKLYPVKTGSKIKAKACYKKTIKKGKTTNKEIQDGIIRMKNHFSKESTFGSMPNGETYFRNERWTDEYQGSSNVKNAKPTISQEEMYRRAGIKLDE